MRKRSLKHEKSILLEPTTSNYSAGDDKIQAFLGSD